MSMCFIHGLSGASSGAEPPDKYKPYVAEAKTLYTGEYDGYFVAENYEYINMGFIKNNFSITSYTPATTEFAAYGWYSCRYHKTTDTWETFDFTENASTGWNYINHFKYLSPVVPSDAVSGESKIYGAIWDRSSSTALSRTRDAVGLSSPVPCVGSTPGSSPFDSIFPWSDIRLCNILNDGTLIYQGDQRFSRTPTSGDVLVEIPKFYARVINTDKIEILISAQPFEGSFVSPAHCDRGDGKGERSKVYVGAYHSNELYRSTSGALPLDSKTRTEFRSGHANRGAGYNTIDFATWWTINLLYLVEFSDWNAQSKIGFGICDSSIHSAPITSGGADSIGGGDTAAHHTGTAGSDISDDAAIKYRHIENWWGNVSSFIEGIKLGVPNAYICLNPASFGDPIENFTNLGITLNPRGGFIKDLAVPNNYPWAMYPSAVGGDRLSFIPDYYDYRDGCKHLHAGGRYNFGNSSGLVCMFTSENLDIAFSSLGGRLMILP